MARTPNPDSATSQFFINHVDNAAGSTRRPAGYAVFGKVIDGHGRGRRDRQGPDHDQADNGRTPTTTSRSSRSSSRAPAEGQGLSGVWAGEAVARRDP